MKTRIKEKRDKDRLLYKAKMFFPSGTELIRDDKQVLNTYLINWEAMHTYKYVSPYFDQDGSLWLGDDTSDGGRRIKVYENFNGAKKWLRLTPEQQAEIELNNARDIFNKD